MQNSTNKLVNEYNYSSDDNELSIIKYICQHGSDEDVRNLFAKTKKSIWKNNQYDIIKGLNRFRCKLIVTMY